MSALTPHTTALKMKARGIILEFGFTRDAIGRSRVYYDLTVKKRFKRYHGRPQVDSRLAASGLTKEERAYVFDNAKPIGRY